MILLSYPLNETTPSFGNSDKVALNRVRRLTAGDSCNKLVLNLSNHAGTHIDCPLHFSMGGYSVTDYDPDHWIMHQVSVIQLQKRPEAASLIGPEILECLDKQKTLESKALLLYTGYGNLRKSEAYWKNPPGFRPELADHLRNKFPKLVYFGFDLISLSSFAHRDIGRLAHQAFLDRPDPILLIEDMNLSILKEDVEINNLFISPLFVEGADSAPCTIWANFA